MKLKGIGFNAVSIRPSQNACMVRIMHTNNLCMILTPLYKNNLKLSFFLSLLCCLLFFLHHIVMLAPLLCCTNFFVCFYKSPFCSLAINQTFLGQSKGWFPFILLCRQGNIIEQVHWVYV